jgi:WD40 repeat protein/tRNA A-37 threonylcarbamoyl transferase component Bud32
MPENDTPTQCDSASQAGLLDEVVAEYLRAVERGESPNRENLLARHPDLADELREFFADHDRMAHLARPLFDATIAPTGTRTPPERIRYFGDYELLEEIARGGMGVVYKARQVRLNRIVAVKMILSGQLASPADLERFHTEAEAAAKLDHPGIVPIFEVGQHEGQQYFSMGFVEGQSLSARMTQGLLPEREAAKIVSTVCDAVQYAHDQGVIHRDLKPGNILVDHRGNPRITDFGLAKLIESHSELTGTGQILGTPSYMPPEQAAGKADQIGPAVDVYSLGAILYCLLTGRPPFQAATPVDTLRQVLEQDPVSASRLNAQVPLDLETILVKCLEKDPRRRYASARELGDELSRFLDGRPILARPVGSFERFWRSCRRNPVVAGLMTTVAACLIAGTVISTYFAVEARDRAEAEAFQRGRAEGALGKADERLYRSLVDQARANRLSRRIGQRFKSLEVLADAARMAREMSLPEAEFLELRSEAIACLALADVRIDAGWDGYPSGSLFVDFDGALERYARSDRDGNVSVRRVADDHELWKLTGMGPGESWPVLSANGEYLWLASGLGYKLWKLAGEEPTVVLERPPVYAAFSPDSRHLATAEPGGTITLFDLPSGEQVNRFETGVQIAGCAWHPQQMQLAIGCPTGVRIVDLTTGTQLGHLQQVNGAYFVAWHPDGKMLAAVGPERSIQIWDVPSGKPIAQLKGHTHGGIICAFSHTGDLLASTGWEGKFRLWNPRTGEQLFQTPVGMPYVLRFSPDDQRLAAALAANGRLAFLEVAPVGNYYRTLIRDPVHGPAEYQTPAISSDGRLLAVGLMDGLGLWDLATGKPLEFLPGSPTYSVLFERSGALLASGAAGLARWPIDVDARAPGTVRIGPQQKLPVNGRSERIAMSRDGRVLGQAMIWGGLVWHQDSPDVPIRLAPHDDARSLDISPDGRWVATGSHLGTTVKIWDASSGQLVRELPLEGGSFVLFSPDGRWLLTTHEEYRLWAVDSWEEIRKLGAGFPSAAFSPDGKILALAELGGVVRLVNPETGKDYARLEDPHQDRAGFMCFSPDGSQLVAIANDSHAMHVWNLRAIREQLAEIGLDWD